MPGGGAGKPFVEAGGGAGAAGGAVWDTAADNRLFGFWMAGLLPCGAACVELLRIVTVPAPEGAIAPGWGPSPVAEPEGGRARAFSAGEASNRPFGASVSGLLCVDGVG